jgi:methionyl-tRNA synthetase
MNVPTKTHRKILVTQALPYANAPLHLGHILEAVQTDIWVRFQNILGNECLFFCADDTHGTPVMLKAKELGITPEELVSNIHLDHKETYQLYNIAFTNFHSTHSEENRKLSELVYTKAKENDFITRKTIEQLYDEKESMFLSDRFVKGSCPKCNEPDQYADGCSKCGATYDIKEIKDPISVISGTKPITKESEHIFFNLPKKLDELKGFLNNADLQKPITNKLSEWLNDDLQQWDISRDAPYFGFKIPGEVDKYFYVWVDAPIGYMASMENWASANGRDMAELWSDSSEYEIYHFIGKDIAYFHGLFWPALLSAANFKLPDGIYVHGFLTINGEKMSKSLGNIIKARDFIKDYNPEILKFLILGVHYRSVLNFNESQINSTIINLIKIYSSISLAESIIDKKQKEIEALDFKNYINNCELEISQFMNNDFNTPGLFSIIFKLVRKFNLLAVNKKVNPELCYISNLFITLNIIIFNNFDIYITSIYIQ